MLRIKEQYKGKTILKGRDVIVLSDKLTQKELLWVNNMVSKEFIEVIDSKPLITEDNVLEEEKTVNKTNKRKKRKSDNDKDTEKSK